VRSFSLVLLSLFLVGCSSLIETGVVNDKDFCFGVCSLNPRAPAVEDHPIQPVEVNLAIKVLRPDGGDEDVPEIEAHLQEFDEGDGCGKETPELCN
jgi:hypothetical protein